MKITSVECYLGQFITMKINTDEGIYGWGEAGLAYGNSFEAAFGQCQDFAKLIIGMDPFDTEKIWEHLHRHTFWGMGGGVVITSAMAAIDTAVKIIGMDDSMELWADDGSGKPFMEPADFVKAMQQIMNPKNDNDR